jgi:hypothetical protein
MAAVSYQTEGTLDIGHWELSIKRSAYATFSHFRSAHASGITMIR